MGWLTQTNRQMSSPTPKQKVGGIVNAGEDAEEQERAEDEDVTKRSVLLEVICVGICVNVYA